MNFFFSLIFFALIFQQQISSQNMRDVLLSLPISISSEKESEQKVSTKFTLLLGEDLIQKTIDYCLEHKITNPVTYNTILIYLLEHLKLSHSAIKTNEIKGMIFLK